MRSQKVRVVVNERTLAAVRTGLAEGLGEVGEETLRIANPPVLTGALAASGFSEVEGEGEKISLVVGYTDEAARYNELGTIHQPARPFLTPAMIEALAGLPATERKAVAKRIRGGPR